MFKCCTVHVQIKTVKIELQRILKVPRTPGAYTRSTTSEGSVQLGWNVLKAEPSSTRRNRQLNEECILVNEITLEVRIECENTVEKAGSVLRDSIAVVVTFEDKSGIT